MFKVALFIVYMIIGFILGIPYALLSSGTGPEDFPLIVISSPVVALVLFTAWQTDRRSKWGFSVCTTYMMLPIIMNGVAKASLMLGYESFGNIVFEYRFMSLSLTILIVILATAFIEGLRVSVNWLQKHVHPPLLLG